MKSLERFALALLLAASSARAQATETKTVDLRHLKPKEAAKLLSPYVKAPSGGVFDVGDNISVITLRDTPDNIAVMEQVLAKYDHTPATIRLVFQLIEADTGRQRGPADRVDADLDATLRSVLRFPSYRTVSRSVASVGEFVNLSQELPTDNRDKQWKYTLRASIGAIRVDDIAASGDRPGTVHLDVSLYRTPFPPTVTRDPDGKTISYNPLGDGVMSTGLDVPLGQMVVLGTSATRSSGAALILTVKPELVPIKP